MSFEEEYEGCVNAFLSADYETCVGHAFRTIQERPNHECLQLVLIGLQRLGRGEVAAQMGAMAAIPPLRQAAEIIRATEGEGSLEDGEAVNSLGRIFLETGQYADAEAHNSRAMQIRRARLGEAHAKYAASLIHLFEVALSAGKLAEAEARARRLVAVRLGTVGEKHPEYAHALGKLASRSRPGPRVVSGGPLARAHTAYGNLECGIRPPPTADMPTPPCRPAASRPALIFAPAPAARPRRQSGVSAHDFGNDHSGRDPSL